jgi:hypothetical protein
MTEEEIGFYLLTYQRGGRLAIIIIVSANSLREARFRIAGISRLCQISTAKILENLSEEMMPVSKLSKLDMGLVLAIFSVLNVETSRGIAQVNRYDGWWPPVLGLRCSWCPGSAPMPKLLGLYALPATGRANNAEGRPRRSGAKSMGGYASLQMGRR